jgi:hypothetical protein
MAKLTNGKLLVSIGVVHTLFGITFGAGVAGPLAGRNLFAEVVAGGVVGTIDSDPWRGLVFWFLFFGFMAMLLGQLMHRMERAGHELPRELGWLLGALTVVGIVLMPASGFWLVLPVALRMLRRRRAPVGAELAVR